MSVLDAIKRAKQITESLISEQPQTPILKSLMSELLEIETQIGELTGKSQTDTSNARLSLDSQSACYRNGEESAYYCPKCYEKNNVLSPTQRINSRLRVCPTCRAGTKSP